MKAIETLVEWINKQHAAYHKHEGWPDHPVAVKDHAAWQQHKVIPTAPAPSIKEPFVPLSSKGKPLAELSPEELKQIAALEAKGEAPWQVPLKNFLDKRESQFSRKHPITAAGRKEREAWMTSFRTGHRNSVARALYQGKSVSPEVLVDYPDLVTKAAPTGR